MKMPAPTNIDDYIATAPPGVQSKLQTIREIFQQTAPGAEEIISYRMPAFKQHGILVYFAAFKNHIGLFPPVKGSARMQKALAPYAGEKGNLRFPLDEPMPFDLIKEIAALRVQQDLAKSKAKSKKKTK
jgi:uncharacterized protein YdhG (YjbR/CyaY superfamily)